MIVNVLETTHPKIIRRKGAFECEALARNGIRRPALEDVINFIQDLNTEKRSGFHKIAFIPYIFVVLFILFMMLSLVLGSTYIYIAVAFIVIFIALMLINYFVQIQYEKRIQALIEKYKEKLKEVYIVKDHLLFTNYTRYYAVGYDYTVTREIHLMPVRNIRGPIRTGEEQALNIHEQIPMYNYNAGLKQDNQNENNNKDNQKDEEEPYRKY